MRVRRISQTRQARGGGPSGGGGLRRRAARFFVTSAALAVSLGVSSGGSAALASNSTPAEPHSVEQHLEPLDATNARVSTLQQVSSASSAPQGPYAGSLTFDITSMTPTVITSSSGPTLSITGTVTNASTLNMESLVARVQRGPALVDSAALAAETSSPSEPIESWSDFADLLPALAAGTSAPFSITVPLYGVVKDTLAVTAPGVYPIMVNINGESPDLSPGGARVGELHLLLPVTSVPPEIAAANPITTPPPVPHQVNFVLPLVDRPHRDATGAFMDDELSTAISDGGRLSNVLDQVEQFTLPSGAITLAVDPELLEELALMSQGYFIGPVQFDIAARAAALDPENFGPESVAVPTESGAPSNSATTSPGAGSGSTGSGSVGSASGTTSSKSASAGAASAGSSSGSTPPASSPSESTSTASPGTSSAGTTAVSGTTASATTGPGATATTPSSTGELPGTPTQAAPVPADPTTAVTGAGTEAAIAFLDRLRSLTETFPVLILPYTDPDSVALTRANLPSFFSEVVSRGRLIADNVLGPDSKLITDIGWPINGVLDDATLAAYQANGFSSMLLEPTAFGFTTETAPTAAQLQTPAGPITAAIADAGIITGLVGANPDDGTNPTTELNLAAAQLVLQAQTGTGSATIFAPSRDYMPTGADYQVMLGLLNELSGDSLISGITLADATKLGGVPAGLQYPVEARGAELPELAFAQIATVKSEFADLEAAFAAPSVTDTTTVAVGPAAPKNLFQPVLDGLYRQAAGALRDRPEFAAEMIAPLHDVVTAVQAKVFIVKPIGSILLTSSDVPIPVSIRNELPFPVQVRVQINAFDARQAGMTVSEEEIHVVPASNGAGLQIQIPLEITKSGKSEVRASLVGPTGQAWGGPVAFQLTSTAFGTFTLWMIAGATAVLLFSLAMRLRRRWRDRHDRVAKQRRDAALTSAPTSGATTIADIPTDETSPATAVSTTAPSTTEAKSEGES